MIQRYRVVSSNEVDVVLAVGDMGQGIRGSLAAKHPELGDDPLGNIQAAMGGSTSRHTGRGGLGLRTVEETMAKDGGYVWLRSETAAIRRYGPCGGDFSHPLDLLNWRAAIDDSQGRTVCNTCR